MKSSKFIKLLATLLCVVMAFVSCSGDTAANVDGASDDVIKPLSEPVPLLEDASAGTTVYKSLDELKEVKYKSADYFKETVKLDGEEVYRGGSAIIMKTSQIGADNLAKEVFKVYNFMNGECILTVENVYDYTKEIKSNEVDFRIYASSVCTVVVVEKITNTLLTQEEIEGNFRFDKSELNYKEESFYEFYDMAGNLFDTSNLSGYAYLHLSNLHPHLDSIAYATPFCVEIDESIHYFNAESEYVRTENENDAGIGAYQWERGNYGYKYSSRYGFIQIFDMLTGKIVAQYDVGNVYTSVIAVLEDGTILLQDKIRVNDNGADYDYIDDYNNKYNLETYLINALTGEKTEVDFDYVLGTVFAISDYRVLEPFTGNSSNYKDTVINFADARKITDKRLSDSLEIFFDNALGLNYVSDRTENAHVLAGKGMLLSNGSVLYTANGYQIIVDKTGKQNVLPIGATVRDPFVITNDNIYDLDLNLIVDRDENYGYESEKLYWICNVADWGIFAAAEPVYPDDYDEDDEAYDDYVPNTETCYYRIYKNGNSYSVEPIYYTGDISFDSVYTYGDSYVILINENNKYALYNSKFEHIYTSENQIKVSLYGDQYWFETYSNFENKNLIFALTDGQPE